MEQKIQSQDEKIAYLITKSNFGGAQKYVYELALEAKNRGFETSVLLGGDGLLSQKLKLAGVSVYQIKSLQRDFGFILEIKSFFEIIKILRKVKPGTLNVNSSKAGAIGALAGRLCGVNKIIFTIHGWAFNESRGSFAKFIIKLIYLITIILSHKSIAVSEKTKRDAQYIPFNFLIRNKIKVIHNGIKEISFNERSMVRDFLAEKFNINQEDFLVGTLAELHPVKGLGFLIEAAKNIEIENFKIIIFGTGQEKERLENLIKDNSLENKVILGGFLEDGAKYLKGFDIFILTSLSEALPLSILEAGQAELPVITTEVGGIPEIIKNNETGLLIKLGNEKEIAEAITKLFENSELANKLKSALKNKIDTEFSDEKFYQKTFDLY